MIRIQILTALILATASPSGFSTEQRGAVEAAVSEGGTPSTPTAARPTVSEEWACSPGQVPGFITDPVVYPADLSLHEVLSRIDGGTGGDIDSNSGRLASATFRNEEGLIVRRVELERSETVGWHIERGRAC